MAETEKGGSHIGYFDYLRLFAAFSVIFMHTAAELLRAQRNVQWELLNVCTALAFTAVPLFLMMSGYLLLSSEKTADVTVLVKKRLPRLIVPLAAWTVIEIIRSLSALESLSLRTFLSALVGSFANPVAVHFWYMYLLIALYAISPILYGGLKSLNRKGHLYILALIGLVLLQTMAAAVLPARLGKLVAFDVIARLRLFSGNICAFLLGYYLGNMKRKVPNGLLAVSAVGLLAVITLGTRFLTLRNGAYTATFLDQSGGFEVVLAACIFLLCKQNLGAKRGIRAVPVVPLFLPIYLMHGVLLAGMQVKGYFPQDFLDVMKFSVINLVVCFLVTKTAATIKPICYLLTGMPYEKACQSCNWVYTYRRIRNWYNGRREAAK